MSNLDQHILDYFTENPSQGAGDIPPLAGEEIPRQTPSRRLTALVDKGELIRVGRGSGSRYLRADLEAYFRLPATQRQRVTYIPERGSRPQASSNGIGGCCTSRARQSKNRHRRATSGKRF